MKHVRSLLIPIVISLGAHGGLPLATADDQASEAAYQARVKPVLERRCYACHGALKQKAGLRLDTVEQIKQGGDSGPAVEPGDSASSVLMDRVTETDEALRMPPEGEPLGADDLAAMRAWIDGGASGPANEAPQKDPRLHWSFLPPVRPALPDGGSAGSEPAGVAAAGDNPIDRFLEAERAARGLKAAPRADRATLLRRVALDLTGLAPTPAEVHAFQADPAEDAYERVVEKLLASPAHGERWGRHWMDIWRYSDWYGFGAEMRNSQPHLWRWRDWIVESLNSDLGYDAMVRQMLAGDEIAPTDARVLAATGFLGRNWYKFNRNVWLQDTVEHTAKAFLGLTFNCARCHDHKYDPIAQDDYYRLRAFFEPYDVRTDRVPGQPDIDKGGLSRVYDAHAETPTYVFARGDEKQPIEDRPLQPGVPAVLQGPEALAIEPVSLPALVYYTPLQAQVRTERLESAAAKTAEAQKALDLAIQKMVAATSSDAASRVAEAERKVALANLTAARADELSIRARIAADDARFAAQPDSRARELAAYQAARTERQAAYLRAEADLLALEEAVAGTRPLPAEPALPREKLQERLEPARMAAKQALAALEHPTQAYTALAPVYPEASSGRRLALARWITDRENPTAARVAVNHIWMRHFGTPLVPTVFDFGNSGKPASHPALLDWLAVEFMENGWSLKHLHRLIVTSKAYQMRSSAAPSDPNQSIDPANTYLWRMNPRRMEAELVRDNLLALTHSLDRTVGGPELDQESALTTQRRSLYYRHAPEKQAVFLKVFDTANTTSCYRRDVSVMPQQSLALINSPLAISSARQLAAQIDADSDTFVTAAFEHVLGRVPSQAESEACRRFLEQQAEALGSPSALTQAEAGPACSVAPSSDPRQRAREDLIHVLINHNDFVTIR